MAAKWQKFSITPPQDFTPAMRQVLGKEVTEFIRQRSENGKDKNNVNFKPYSKEYVKSQDFKNAGKKEGDINLTLSGDMLATLDVLSERSDKIIIGFENHSDENKKADGNVRGTYGKSKPTGKARDFMGITKKDLDIITRGVRSRYGSDDDDGVDTVAAFALAKLLERTKT